MNNMNNNKLEKINGKTYQKYKCIYFNILTEGRTSKQS